MSVPVVTTSPERSGLLVGRAPFPEQGTEAPGLARREHHAQNIMTLTKRHDLSIPQQLDLEVREHLTPVLPVSRDWNDALRSVTPHELLELQQHPLA